MAGYSALGAWALHMMHNIGLVIACSRCMHIGLWVGGNGRGNRLDNEYSKMNLVYVGYENVTYLLRITTIPFESSGIAGFPCKVNSSGKSNQSRFRENILRCLVPLYPFSYTQ